MIHHLILPPSPTPRSRLDLILTDCAKRGVHVFVLAWNESKVAFGFDNLYVKQQLEALHPNIRVVNHPTSSPTKDFRWSHHDKLVIVDRDMVGGSEKGLCGFS